MPAKIEYNGSTVATIESGKTATLPIKDKKMATDIKVVVDVTEVPEYTKVAGFEVFASAADEGSLELGYTTPQDVKLSAPSGSASAVRFVSLDDDNFVSENIKYGVTIFGMMGSCPMENCPTETWVLTLKDGSTVTKKVPVFSASDETIKTFTIDGETFRFEEGMTWYQWAGSSYAPDSYNCAGNDSRVKPTGYTYIVDRDGEEVLGKETVIAGDEYSIVEDV